jgi:hypothetical protein
MGALDYLADRTHPDVIAALKRDCGICKAKPGHDCRYPWETNDHMDRIVHLSRVQAPMDKRKRKAG